MRKLAASAGSFSGVACFGQHGIKEVGIHLLLRHELLWQFHSAVWKAQQRTCVLTHCRPIRPSWSWKLQGQALYRKATSRNCDVHFDSIGRKVRSEAAAQYLRCFKCLPRTCACTRQWLCHGTALNKVRKLFNLRDGLPLSSCTCCLHSGASKSATECRVEPFRPGVLKSMLLSPKLRLQCS